MIQSISESTERQSSGRMFKRKLQGIYRLRPWEYLKVSRSKYVSDRQIATHAEGSGIRPSPEEKVEEPRRYKDECHKRSRARTGRHDDHVRTAAYRQRNARDSLLGRRCKSAGGSLGSAF